MNCYNFDKKKDIFFPKRIMEDIKNENILPRTILKSSKVGFSNNSPFICIDRPFWHF